MKVFSTFLGAVVDTVTGICDSTPSLSAVNSFTITESGTSDACKVEGESWTFYLKPYIACEGEPTQWQIGTAEDFAA